PRRIGSDLAAPPRPIECGLEDGQEAISRRLALSAAVVTVTKSSVLLLVAFPCAHSRCCLGDSGVPAFQTFSRELSRFDVAKIGKDKGDRSVAGIARRRGLAVRFEELKIVLDCIFDRQRPILAGAVRNTDAHARSGFVLRLIKVEYRVAISRIEIVGRADRLNVILLVAEIMPRPPRSGLGFDAPITEMQPATDQSVIGHSPDLEIIQTRAARVEIPALDLPRHDFP